MTKPKSTDLIRLCMLVIAAMLAACSSGGGGSSGGVTLRSISVTPDTASIASGVAKQFSALGTYSDGTSKDITATVTWSSATTTVSTVSAAGLVTGVATGSAVITATSGQVSGSTTLTVTAAVLQSIAVTPVNPAIPKGQVRQMLATGTYSDGTSQDISATVTWSSDTPATATVTAAGLATGVATGSAVITATSGAMSGSTTLTVTAAVLQSIAVTPGSPVIPKGLSQQMVATGTYSDGTSQDISATVAWNSDTTATATINAAGLVTGVAMGSTTLTATSGAISGSTILNVSTAVLQSIAVTPGSPSIPKGLLQRMVATATYSDNTTQDVTATVTWSSSNTAVATVNSGNANGVATGVATLTASSGAISGSATLHVTAAVLQFIAVTPSSPVIPLGLTRQLVATGTYSDHSSQNITSSVTWTSATTSIATVNAAGLATSVAAGGSSLITATADSISGSTTLTVTSAVLQSITVTPANPVVGRYLTRQLTATGTYTDATSQDITALVTWTSGTTSVATVNTGGLSSAVAVGTATITATLGATQGNTLLTVIDPTYTIGGTVYGLNSGKTITLQKNGADNLTVTADGAFTFATAQNNQTAYSATILTLPTGQPCTITYASGTVTGANVNNISVICSESIAGSAGLFVAADPMNDAREAHTATLLADGRVLVTGGLAAAGGAIATAELYDPVSGLWITTGSMTANRAYHTATLLQDGKVLVTGGVNFAGITVATSELYDPAAGTWTVTKTGATQTVMTSPRTNHTATLLPNGKVLVAGGYQSGFDLALNTSELYDPATQTWTATSGGMAPRKSHTATLLPNGKVLLVGGSNGYGYLSSIDIYNPSLGSNGSWLTNTPDMSTISAYHTATLLPDGKVLVTGGTTIDQQFLSRSTAEIYDPESGINGSWTVLPNSMNIARSNHAATLLANGKVLVSGGFDGVAFLKSAELYDPATGSWSVTGDLPNLVAFHSSTLLRNGKVLVTGGGLSETSGVDSASLYW